jgi:signal peptidase II
MITKEKKNRIIFIILLVLAIVGFDQISKIIVRQNVESNSRTALVDKYLTLTKVENTGAFLSLGNNLPHILYVLLMIILPLIVVGFAIYYLITKPNLSKLFTIGICMFAGGGVGNVIDRILFGSVTDFLYFDFVIFHTGVVNIADIAVTAGLFVLIYDAYINKNKLTPKASE